MTSTSRVLAIASAMVIAVTASAVAIVQAHGGAGPGATLSRDLILTGLAVLTLGLPFVWWQLRSNDRALATLAATVDATARRGELTGLARPLGTSAEIDRLQRAFRRLMATVEASQRARERSYVEAVGAVVAAIDARDHETTGHSFRVAHYALALAKELGIDGNDLQSIEWGALLHDVGKIAVPDAILRKPGPLDPDEWRVMRRHPVWGFEMLVDVQFLRGAIEVVYSHHERWDGGGYPLGLAGEQIPLSARIFAVADTYDSITSDRPYRVARSHEEAVAELERVAGEQLDPMVVEAFQRIPREKLANLRQLSEQFDLAERVPFPGDDQDRDAEGPRLSLGLVNRFVASL